VVLRKLASVSWLLPLAAGKAATEAHGGVGYALPVGWRLLQSYLALLLLAPLRTRRLHIAPGPTGKAHEVAAMHLHPQATLAVGAVKGAEGSWSGKRLLEVKGLARCGFERYSSGRAFIVGFFRKAAARTLRT
jgi:hypothetical protein